MPPLAAPRRRRWQNCCSTCRTTGADGRIRTDDLQFTKLLLYQLSYVGDWRLAGRQNCCSANQLNISLMARHKIFADINNLLTATLKQKLYSLRGIKYLLSLVRKYFLVGRVGFEPTKAKANRFTVCPV